MSTIDMLYISWIKPSGLIQN